MNHVCVCVCVLVVQFCPTVCDPMDCSPPCSSVHGYFQARILEWAAIPFCRGSSLLRDWTGSPPSQADFTVWVTREAPRIDNNKCLYCAVFKALCSKICSSLSSLPLHDNPIRRRLLLSFTSYRWENESMETLRSLQLTQIVDLEFESRQCN